MTKLRLAPALVLLCGLAWTQDRAEELTPYSVTEVENLLHTFKQTYKNKNQPEEDAVSVLGNMKKAYLYLMRQRGEGDEPITKEEEKAAEKIVDMIAKRGLKVRNRPLVSLECARVLGEIEAEDGAKDLGKWLEGVLDEKAPLPQHVEYGFLSLAWIGPDHSPSRDLVLKYATTGKHNDIGVASQALRACYEWRELDGKDRKEFFEKILGYLGGLWSSMKGGEAKYRATYEQRYNAVKDHGLRALTELCTDGTKFTDPTAAQEWWNEHKKEKWDDYYGPRERAKRGVEQKKADEDGDKEPEAEG